MIDPTAVVHALPMPALLIGADGTLVAVNMSGTMLLGVDADAIGLRASDLPLLRRLPGLREGVLTASRGGAPRSFPLRSLPTTRGFRNLRVRISVAGKSVDGTAPVLVIAEDITEEA